MKTVRKVLERKWNLIHHTFWYDRDNFEFLFNDFRNYLIETKELKEIVKKLQGNKVIPEDFFNAKNKKESWRKYDRSYSDPLRDDFMLIERIYVFILNETDLTNNNAVSSLNKNSINSSNDKSKKILQQKKLSLKKNALLDLFKLPSKYSHNEENLIENKYIDDNSLFVYFCILRGFFDIKDEVGRNFIFFKPFEWTSVDFISFLLSACRDYDLEIEKIKTIIPAIEDDYEISNEPREYRGAYKWILELKEKEPNREEVKLFNKFLSDTASASDLEQALIYADRIAPMYKDEESELYLSKDLFREILAYASFSIISKPFSENKLEEDIKRYLDLFAHNKLTRNNKAKRIGGALVKQSHNIFTYEKHDSMFREYLQKMQKDFGNNLTIENKFEEKFPNLEYPESEFIRKRYEERSFLFMHILLSFKKQGFIKISYLGNNWDYHEDRELTYISKVEILPKLIRENLSQKAFLGEGLEKVRYDRKQLKSIHLITESVAVGDVIFLVLDERYEIPIRFDTKNNVEETTYIKKLHDIAYIVNAPEKKVDYNKRLADDINNGLFKRRQIKEYMQTNNFKKPTLVQKSEDGKTLVLKNEIPIKTILIHAVPSQHQCLYIDKTK